MTAIYDSNGSKVGEYAYDVWGNCTILSGVANDLVKNNPIRYRGYYFDRETGLYYLNARYYNPEWRRFISPDSTDYLDPETPNGLNLYAYCNNDPVNYADPSGHFGFWAAALIGAGILGLVGLGATIHADYSDDGKAFNGSIGADAYILNTLVSGSVGALFGGLTFTFAPMISAFLGSGSILGSYALANGGVVALSIAGAIIAVGVLVAELGISVSLFSQNADRYKRKNVGSNFSQNQFIDHLQQKYGFSDEVRRRLHDRITKRGYSNKKVEEILRKLIGLDR